MEGKNYANKKIIRSKRKTISLQINDDTTLIENQAHQCPKKMGLLLQPKQSEFFLAIDYGASAGHRLCGYS